MSLFHCPTCNGVEFLRDKGQWQCNSLSCNYVFQPDAGHPEFHRILDEMRALHVKKAADYGLGKDVLANCRGSEEFGIPGWMGVAMRMNDKMTRVKALAQHGELKNEPIEDSFLDMACYSIIALILYREQKEKQK